MHVPARRLLIALRAREPEIASRGKVGENSIGNAEASERKEEQVKEEKKMLSSGYCGNQ